MRNIILIGMMGCGKTTVAELLSQLLGREWVDTDAMIEEREGRSVSTIFEQNGEEYFREKELEVCRELRSRSGLIIACGGGLPLQSACAPLLKSNGLVFWLDRDPKETYDSLDTTQRPLAQTSREAFLARYTQRAPVYRVWANYVVARPSSPEDAAAEIVRFLTGKEQLT